MQFWRLIMFSNILICCLSMTVGLNAADTDSQHPAYVHALNDLHDASAWLAKPEGSATRLAKQLKAQAEIEAAMNQIVAAMISAGKKPGSYKTIDVKLPRAERLKRALRHLDHAYAEIQTKENNKFAKGLQQRAMRHIDAARRAIRQIM